MATKAPVSLKGRALQLLALRDYSRQEMEQRLLRWLQAQHAKNALGAGAEPDSDDSGSGLDEDALLQQYRSAIAEVLDSMQDKGYLSDQRAAQAVAQRRASQFGVLRIQQELKTKGIAPELAQDLLDSLRGSEVVRAHAVWKKRFGQLPATLAERSKQTRYLASRGFGADAVRAVLRGMAVDGDDL